MSGSGHATGGAPPPSFDEQNSAVAEAIYLRMALSGPPGGGKTFSAFAIAEGLDAGLVAVIDTERGSALRYRRPRGPFAFTHARLDGDYGPRRYLDFIAAAAKRRPGVLVIDSFSHAWEGKNGILEQVDKKGGSQRAWGEIKPLERELIGAVLDFPGHVICTLRTKNAYEDVERNGKVKKEKIGLAAVQREGLEYEFDVVLRVENARARVEKTRCPALSDKTFDRPGGKVAELLKPWLGGEPVLRESLAALGERLPSELEKIHDFLSKRPTTEQLAVAIQRLEAKLAKRPASAPAPSTAPPATTVPAPTKAQVVAAALGQDGGFADKPKDTSSTTAAPSSPTGAAAGHSPAPAVPSTTTPPAQGKGAELELDEDEARDEREEHGDEPPERELADEDWPPPPPAEGG